MVVQQYVPIYLLPYGDDNVVWRISVTFGKCYRFLQTSILNFVTYLPS
jgi:hypothetical protein